MKTLVFCTSYNESVGAWDRRHGLWLRSLRRSELYYDQLLIVDDASPVMPNWGTGLTIVHEADGAAPKHNNERHPVLLYRFSDRLGRQSVFEFPGWHRSFAFAILYGIRNGFEKIVHIESDAYLVSTRAQRFFNSFEDGWFGLWSKKYAMPEMAIQAAAGASLKDMADFARQPYENMIGQNHELLIPFTHTERQFIGDRYGEHDEPIPRSADYATQVLPGKPDYEYWWIPEAEPLTPRRKTIFEKVMTFAPPFEKDILSGAWSPEQNLCWMVNWESVLCLPPVRSKQRYMLRISLMPCVFGEIKQQRLIIIVNQHLVKDLVIYRQCHIYIDLPPDVLLDDAPNIVTFIHPDGFRPSDEGFHSETRNLSVAIDAVTLSLVAGIKLQTKSSLIVRNKNDVVFLQTSDEHVYADMLFQTSRTVRRYCKRHAFKYEAYIGIKRGYWPYQATFNRIYMLKELVDRQFSGWAIYMDADAFVVDFDFDLAGLIEANRSKAFLATPSGASNQYWDVNAGVFFVNLAHPTALRILDQWKSAYDAASDEKLLACSEWYTGVDDQQMLHQILHGLPTLTSECGHLDWDVINSPHASFIRQHLRAGHPTFEARVAAIEHQVDEVMQD